MDANGNGTNNNPNFPIVKSLEDVIEKFNLPIELTQFIREKFGIEELYGNKN